MPIGYPEFDSFQEGKKNTKSWKKILYVYCIFRQLFESLAILDLSFALEIHTLEKKEENARNKEREKTTCHVQ